MIGLHTGKDRALEGRKDLVRIASAGALVGWTWLWSLLTTGAVTWSVLGLLLAFTLVCLSFGRAFVASTRGIVHRHAGIGYEMLTGFLIANTSLFALTLVSPLGMPGDVFVLGAIAVALRVVPWKFRIAAPTTLDEETASLACILFTGLAATFWVRDQQPIMAVHGDLSVFTVWADAFIHAREISAFAQSHGIATISDIKLAEVAALPYHFSSYMMPAALDALTPMTALDAYAAFQLPLGILLTGLAAHALVSTVFRATWPGAVASAAVVALPDAYMQGFGIRYLSYHFMSQVNLGMLYGIACISIAWLFMIEGCRHRRVAGVFVAWLLLAICLSFKAHLFVANALILLLYPCVFFGRAQRARRVVAAVAMIAVFIAVVRVSQMSPRVPTLRLDGSGTGDYVRILMGGFAEGRPKSFFHWAYFEHVLPRPVNAALAAALILVCSFGWWLFVAPFVLWKSRPKVGSGAIVFVVLIVTNYMVMALLLALDRRGVGSSEEFLNRPQAWAYFVVVAFVAAAAWIARFGSALPASRVGRATLVVVGGVMLCGVWFEAHDLQTFPEWGEDAAHAHFDAVPTCLVRSARYVREHARTGDVMQDSRLDPALMTTAIAERQGYVARADFGGRSEIVAERAAAIDRIQASDDPKSLKAWARARRVEWYLLHPEDSDHWSPQFLQQAVFRCDEFRVFRLGPGP